MNVFTLYMELVGITVLYSNVFHTTLFFFFSRHQIWLLKLLSMPSSKTGGGRFSLGNATIGKQQLKAYELLQSSILTFIKAPFLIIHLMINISDLCRLGLYREAEKQFRSALNHQAVVDTYLYLAKVWTSQRHRVSLKVVALSEILSVCY